MSLTSLRLNQSLVTKLWRNNTLMASLLITIAVHLSVSLALGGHGGGECLILILHKLSVNLYTSALQAAEVQ